MTTNPTKTRTIEAAWLRDIARRFRVLRREVKQRLRPEQIINALEMSIEQQRIFMAWLELRIEELFLADNWQDQYQLASYNRALKRVRADLIAAGEEITLTAAELDIARASDFDFSATPSLFTASAPPQQIHQDALEFLFTRSYDDLKTATNAMSGQIRTILFDGVTKGEGLVEVGRQINRVMQSAEYKAQRIARTETIQAYQRATINESERAQEELGGEYKLVWITARDERVRKLHAGWHGTIASQKRTLEKINESPWNCRCAQRIVTPAMLTEARKSKWAKERVAIMLLAS